MDMREDKLKLEPLYVLLPKMLNSRHGDVYLQGDYPWNAYSLGLLFYSDGYGTNTLETHFPDFIKNHRLSYVMQIGRAEDALRNAYFQIEALGQTELSMEDAVACFNHHYRYDGYLELE
jgi:hypothetical protein